MPGESLGYVPLEAQEFSTERGTYAEHWEARRQAKELLGARSMELRNMIGANGAGVEAARTELESLRELSREMNGENPDNAFAATVKFIRQEIKRLNDETSGEPAGKAGQKVDELIKLYGAFHENLTENK